MLCDLPPHVCYDFMSTFEALSFSALNVQWRRNILVRPRSTIDHARVHIGRSRRAESDVAVDASCDVLHTFGGLHYRARNEVFATIRTDFIGCVESRYRHERVAVSQSPLWSGVNLAAFVLRLAFEIHYLDFFPTTF